MINTEDQPLIQWPEKEKVFQFNISPTFNIVNKGWIENTRINNNINPILSNEILNSFILGPIHSTLRTMLTSNFKPKLAIYTPPLQIQDDSLHNFTNNEFLSLTFDHLVLIQKILAENGFILVHNFGTHYAQTKILLDEIFGRNNFIATLIWNKNLNRDRLQLNYPYLNNSYYHHPFDYLTIYARDINLAKMCKFPPTLKGFFNPDNDSRGPWESRPLIASEKSSNPTYTYKFKNGQSLTRKFRYAPSTIKKIEEENRIHYTYPKNRPGIPRVKIFYRDRLDMFQKTGKKGRTSNSLWADATDFGSIDQAILDSSELYPLKTYYPIQSRILYEKLILLLTQTGDTVLDCFAEHGISILNALLLNRSWVGLVSQMDLLKKHLIPWLEKKTHAKLSLKTFQSE